MSIIIGGAGSSSGGSGAISGGFKIFELMFNQTTDAALPVGTYRPAVFTDKASMQAYFTKHTTEFDRLKESGRVCEVGTIDAQGKPLTINNEAYSYVEGETDPWVDVVGGLIGGKGDQGKDGTDGKDVTSATVNGDGDLVLSISDGTEINAGRVKGEDGDLVYQQLSVEDYANFFDANWSDLKTNIYGITALGGQFTNAPFPLNADTTYSFECLLVNESSQYSLRVTSMTNSDFENSGRDAILSGLTKTSAESTGWKTYAFTSDSGHTDPSDGFNLKSGKSVGFVDKDGTDIPVLKYDNADIMFLGDSRLETVIETTKGLYVNVDYSGAKRVLLEGESAANRSDGFLRDDLIIASKESFKNFDELYFQCDKCRIKFRCKYL